MELKDTVNGMISDDYKERFKAEYIQLDTRLNKLKDILNKYAKNTLDFTPKSRIELLIAQAKCMEEYKDILRERAAQEEINIDLF